MKYLLDNQETARIRFRQIHLDDFPTWLAFFKDPESSKYWISEDEPPEQACKKWYANQFRRYRENLGGMNALIEKQSGKLVGHCGLLVQEVDGIRELEIGYSLLPEFWHLGFATEAARKCRDYAFENRLADSLISIISLENKPSERVAVKNGMHIEKSTVYKANRVNIFRINSV